jgi:hypothetical protein
MVGRSVKQNFFLLFFACPKKSNKRKGTTLTNHKLLLVAQSQRYTAACIVHYAQFGGGKK